MKGAQMFRSAAAVVLGVLLLTGCSGSETGSSGDPTGSAAASPGVEATGEPGGNGTLVTVQWSADVVLEGHPIGADGTVGAAQQILSGPADDSSFPAAIDGAGTTVLTGTFADYWTDRLVVHEGGQVVGEVDAPQWCGGEGLTYAHCVLLDGTRIARTTELGRDPATGEGAAQGSILVSSLDDGATLARYGPIDDLSGILGTASAEEILVVTTPFDEGDDARPSTILRMDLGDGSTTPVGTSPPGWGPLCPIGADSVLGYTTRDVSGGQAIDTLSTTAVVGPATAAEVQWEVGDAVGCSADGRFLFLQDIPAPPTGENDTEAPNPPTTVERVDLATGQRHSALVLDPGVQVALVTR
jgi:hypothetical protein